VAQEAKKISMKILITAENSFIGNTFSDWLSLKDSTFLVTKLSLRNINLDGFSFSNFDIVFHVAGIAHIKSSKRLKRDYFRVNRDLAIEVAQKAKRDGCKHFIFTSTMAIYGEDNKIGLYKSIQINKYQPTTAYGLSKLQADLAIQDLMSDKFLVSILRLPMIYGETVKGNFIKLIRLAIHNSVYPNVNNKRSVLNILNLCELTYFLMKNSVPGVFHPQDREYFSTNYFINKIRKKHKKKTYYSNILSLVIVLLSSFLPLINKVYGNKFYEKSDSVFTMFDYQVHDLVSFINEKF